MGGCRCTYRNCKTTSDGTTHFFHYPVFDKQRCHQWIVNARRPEFVDLKVSQLKNRVVCQHHFRAELFMNFKRDRLTHDAIPTENGPFIKEDSSDKSKSEDVAIPTKLENITSDDSKYFIAREKVAAYGIPYSDYLTKQSFETIYDPSLKKSLVSPNKNIKSRPIIVPRQENIENESVIDAQNKSPQVENKEISRRNPKRKKVVILAEKKIETPLVIKPPPELKEIPQPYVLKTRTKSTEEKDPEPLESSRQKGATPKTFEKDQAISNYVNPEVPMLEINIEAAQPVPANTFTTTEYVHKVLPSDETYPRLLPIQYDPENENTPVVYIMPEGIDTDSRIISNNQNDSSYRVYNVPPKHQSTSSIRKSKHTCRSRRKMSSLSAALLAKVNENSRDISEIKSILQNHPASQVKIVKDKAIGPTPEDRRKYLYDEISKYISTELKNELFEELFLNFKKNKRF